MNNLSVLVGFSFIHRRVCPVVPCMNILKSVIWGFKPKIYKLIHYVLYEHLSDLVAMVSK